MGVVIISSCTETGHQGMAACFVCDISLLFGSGNDTGDKRILRQIARATWEIPYPPY